MPTANANLPYLHEIDEARGYSNFGPQLTRFEQRLADRLAAPTQVVTVTNATQALTLALQAIDLAPGGYVAMPAWTFVATAHAVIQAGLNPWFVDVDPVTWMLDPTSVEELALNLNIEVAAVIPVCAFGAMPDLERWLAFREATGVPVLIDAAAAFDTLSDARLPAVVSLHATKVLGAGEGGFLATVDPKLALRVKQLTSFGFDGSRDSLIPATNAKLSEYAAAVGLAALDNWPGDRLRFMRTAQQLRIALIGRPEVVFQDGWGSDWITSVCTVGLPRGTADAVRRRPARGRDRHAPMVGRRLPRQHGLRRLPARSAARHRRARRRDAGPAVLDRHGRRRDRPCRPPPWIGALLRA